MQTTKELATLITIRDIEGRESVIKQAAARLLEQEQLLDHQQITIEALNTIIGGAGSTSIENIRFGERLKVELAQQGEQQPVAKVAEVHMSRYTLEWTNGPLPEGTELYTVAAPAAQPDNEADELLRNLGLEPEAYRTDGGYINHLKVKAAIRHPENYPQKCAHEWGNAPASLGCQICKHCGRPEPVEAAPAAQPVQGEQPTDTEHLADMLIAHPESSHVRTAVYAELLLLSKQVGQLRKSNFDARKLIEQMMGALEHLLKAHGYSSYINAEEKELDHDVIAGRSAIAAGQQWLKENK